ncbi:MAG: hypothetical protein D6796_08105 [Caldilineae bacterium]|nr:MAG: hypothetical protein D6796_08105 [Caldilineae bacterium]
MDLHDTVQNAMGGFEELVKKIPGYSGYKEKEQRREADALLREHLAREFEAQWARTNDLKSQMLIGPALSQLDEMGRASRRLQTLIDKIKAAAQGYAGFFDAVKVKEDQLDELYRFDNAMLAKVDEVSAAIDAVQAALDAGDNVAAAVRQLNRLVDELIAHFDRRKDVITGLLEA